MIVADLAMVSYRGDTYAGPFLDYEAGQQVLDLLRDLAEDRHELGLDMAEEGWTGYGHTGTLRTCVDRLCEQAAQLLKNGGG